MHNSNNENKPFKIFISHAGKDKAYVEKLVELLEDIGVGEKDMFCSSVEGYGIPMDENIYDYLQKQFWENSLHVIFVLSESYYASAACLNEMGAAWVLRNKYSSILLPGFQYEQIVGAIDPLKIVLKLDEDERSVNQHLGELMDGIVAEFGLTSPSRSKWERIRNRFKGEINKIAAEKLAEKLDGNAENGDEESSNADKGTRPVTLSSHTTVFLAYAGTDKNGTVMICRTLGGTSVSAGNWNFVGNGDAREEARWVAVVEKLARYGLLEAESYKREVFNLTYNGFLYSDKAREKIDTDKSPDEYLKDEKLI